MDWSALVWIILCILGAGLIFGGIVAYRGSGKPGVRAVAAALIATGLAMWAIIGFTIPASISLNNSDSPTPVVVVVVKGNSPSKTPVPLLDSPAPIVATDVIPSKTYEPFTQERVAALLSVEDINQAAGGGQTLTVEFRDGKEMASNVDPSQVVEIESWFTSGFQSLNPIRGLTFSVMDFSSARAAQEHFDNVISETPGLIFMDPPIGDISAHVVFNGQGLGSIVMYRLGDRFVSLHTAQVFGVEPIMPVGGLEALARLVESRMQ